MRPGTFVILIAIVSLSSLQSCSVMSEIVLANLSSAPLSVSYTLRARNPADETCSCAAGFYYDPPAIIAVDSVAHTPWHFLNDSAFRFDTSSRRFDIVLAPRTALLLSREPYALVLADSGGASRLNITAVTVRGAAGEATWSGLPLYHAFHAEGRGIYALRYP